MKRDHQTQIPTEDVVFLLEELTHRVHNQYAVLISELSNISDRTLNEEIKAAHAAAAERLHRYAAANRVLLRPRGSERIELSSHLAKVCTILSEALLIDLDLDLTFIEQGMIVDRELCWRLGLIVSELLTNAARHGPQAGGAIRVELACSEDQIRCHVLSNGVGDMPVRQGRGSEIVSALGRALGGSVSWTFTHRATIATVQFPSGGRSEELSRSASLAVGD